jgi:hypothetical protein
MASTEYEEWLQTDEEQENENMMDHGIFEVTQSCDLPKGANVLSTTWELGLLVAMSCVLAILIAGTMETASRPNALLSWVVWVVTIIVDGTNETLNLERDNMKRWMTVGGRFEQETQEQVGWKTERDHTERWMKVVCNIEQNNKEYFGCKIDRDKTKRGEIMSENDKVPSSKNMVQTYRNGVMNRVRQLSRLMSSLMDAHLTRMYKVKSYVKHTASLRKIMKPHAVWGGVNKSFEMDNEDGVVKREEVVIAVPWIRNNLMS